MPNPVHSDSILRFSSLRRRLGPWGRLVTLGTALFASTGCDSLKERLWPVATDPVWQGDSSVLAAKPEILFRVARRGGNVRMIPMATVGASGFRMLNFSNRGWRALDLQYMNRGNTLMAYRGGRAAGETEIMRGMWDQSAGQLDSIPGCQVLVPVGIPTSSENTWLFTSGKRPPLKPVKTLSDAERVDALHLAGTLIAPTAGINAALLERYTRTVNVASTGATEAPSIVVVYDDPETVADSITPIGIRPRHLVIVLDRGLYGYRQSYSYSTVGNAKSPPRLEFLDYIDVDDDGKAELFFGIKIDQAPFYTIVLKYENERWTEMLRFGGDRCRG